MIAARETVGAVEAGALPFQRDAMWDALGAAGEPWDLVIVGGGATGLAAAVDAAMRGLRVGLFERADFASGTSSRSTKLVHGGLRYLRQGRLGLVAESLRERARLRDNAPHLVNVLGMVIPLRRPWERPFYGAGLALYDRLAGRAGFGRAIHLSRAETLRRLPNLAPEGVRGGWLFHDGQFDDARLALVLARSAAAHGAVTLNHAPVRGLLKAGGRIAGVAVEDAETGRTVEVPARAVLNAAGVFADEVRRLDEPSAPPLLRLSQGAHLVLPAAFLGGWDALMEPHTDDERVLFAVPWHDRVLLGTTDTPVDAAEPEPRPLEEEVDFLLGHARRLMARAPGRGDVLCAFAGLRPLPAAGTRGPTAALSRRHTLVESPSGLLTLLGGKWTTCRQMAEEAVDAVLRQRGWEPRPCRTRRRRLYGWTETPDASAGARAYGTDEVHLVEAVRADHSLGGALHPSLPFRRVEAWWAVREEMARTVDDVLSRRLRALPMDALAAAAAAPAVAHMLATHLGRDAAWEAAQVASFAALCDRHLLKR